MKTLYCGLELHSTESRVVSMNEDGKVLSEREVETSGSNLIEAFEALEGRLKIHLEASEMAGWARNLLLERVPAARKVTVSHPKSNAWIANDPLKGDSVDARKLADLMRMGRTHEVFYPEDRRLGVFKKTVQHYEDLTGNQARLKQKIKARLRLEGIHAEGTGVFSEDGRKLTLEAIEDQFRREAIAQLYDLLDDTLRARDRARKLMRKQSKSFPIVQHFREVPGIGLVLACRFVGYIQNPHRFATKSKLWRYCRLGVTERSSNGKPLGYRRLDPNGCGALKDLSRKAFQAAISREDNNGVKRFYRSSISRTNNEEHARLNTQRKILAVMWAMWRKGERYDDSQMG